MEYYLGITCPSCGEEFYYGVCMTFLEHKGRPVITWDSAAQEQFDCEHCGEPCYTGEFELLTKDQV